MCNMRAELGCDSESVAVLDCARRLMYTTWALTSEVSSLNISRGRFHAAQSIEQPLGRSNPNPLSSHPLTYHQPTDQPNT